MKIEILYLSWNRLKFSEMSFEMLKRNTDWRHVDRLVVYDDGSEDGTREMIAEKGKEFPVPAFELRDTCWRSTGAIMNDFIALTEAEQFVKIDNDICMPPGWLPPLLRAADRHQQYELIGMEAGWTGPPSSRRPRSYGVTPAQHIGGVGLMRVSAFANRKPIAMSLGKEGRAGFTVWQHNYAAAAGWITPDLAVVQLDRIPIEPWATLTASYVEKGWAREWAPYKHDMHAWWDWMPDPAEILTP